MQANLRQSHHAIQTVYGESSSQSKQRLIAKKECGAQGKSSDLIA
ncbi:MAG: hypothetical protein P1U46_01775 [Patescibacteria group bacterium]|nr:hypothetical protein [Patescibacteria group bacterium]